MARFSFCIFFVSLQKIKLNTVMSYFSKSYFVKPTTLENPSKTLSNDAWQAAHVLQDFQYPWQSGQPPQTLFRALHSADTFYFQFEVEDQDLYAEVVENEQMEVAESSRVELFFCQDQNLNPYYCLEMDYLGRLLCNSAKFHRQMDYNWNWPAGFQFTSELSANGFILAGSISKASLQQLGLLQHNEIHAGIFRGQYSNLENQAVRWISWVDPQTPKPDFHVPSAFGLLKLV